MDYNIEQINHLIRNRRSLYPQNFSEEIIPRKIIEEILENANWAPTHGLTQPWHFTIFHGEGLQKLAEFQAELYKNATSPELFLEAKYNKLITNPTQCSHVIAIGMKRDTRGKIPEIEEIESVACAVQNMHLTCTAYGIGAYWGSGGVTYLEEAKPFFGLEPQDKLLGFFFMGYPKIEWPKGRRTPISEKTTWVE